MGPFTLVIERVSLLWTCVAWPSTFLLIAFKTFLQRRDFYILFPQTRLTFESSPYYRIQHRLCPHTARPSTHRLVIESASLLWTCSAWPSTFFSPGSSPSFKTSIYTLSTSKTYVRSCRFHHTTSALSSHSTVFYTSLFTKILP